MGLGGKSTGQLQRPATGEPAEEMKKDFETWRKETGGERGAMEYTIKSFLKVD